MPLPVPPVALALPRPRTQAPAAGRGARQRSSSPAKRAIWLGLIGLLSWLGPSCDHGDASGANSAQASQPPRERIDRLVKAFTPLAKTVTSDKTDAQFIEGQRLLGELSAAGPEVGREALARLAEHSQEKRPQQVERALLIVGAHAAPEDAKVLLENLITQYGTDLALRTEATLLLAEVQPARALELLEPYVRRARASQTLPPAEFIVRAWVTACERTKTNPVPALADAAANMFMEEAARVRAVKELGRHPDDRLAEKTLSAILIESTGDGYLRRMAAQSLLAMLPREEACVLFTQVADKEADANMLQFLKDILDKNCKR